MHVKFRLTLHARPRKNWKWLQISSFIYYLQSETISRAYFFKYAQWHLLKPTCFKSYSTNHFSSKFLSTNVTSIFHWVSPSNNPSTPLIITETDLPQYLCSYNQVNLGHSREFLRFNCSTLWWCLAKTSYLSSLTVLIIRKNLDRGYSLWWIKPSGLSVTFCTACRREPL